MRQDTFELLIVEQVQDSVGDGDGSMFWVSAGGEGIRALAGNDVDLRHGQILLGREAFDNVVDTEATAPG